MLFSFADLPFLLMLPVLLAASAFFSGSETALFGLSAHQRFALTRSEGVVGRAVAGLLNDQRALLITLMLGNMTANVLYFVVSSALILTIQTDQVSPVGLAIVTVVPLVAIIVFGEILPKLVANTATVGWIRACALPLYAAHRVIAPLGVGMGMWIVQPLVRLLAPPSGRTSLNTDEMQSLVEISRGHGVIGSNEQELLRQVLDLGQRRVRDIMTPRVDLETIDIHEPPHRLRERIDADPNTTKLLAYDKTLDLVAGVIHVRQFLLARRLEPNVSLAKLVRQVRFVPEVQRVDQLLEDFRRTGTNLAVVVDEYGGTAGLVTLKDVVERMVGELDLDETATEAGPFETEQLNPNLWRVSGRLSVHDWAQAFGAETIPPRVATVGGLVLALLRRVPRVGDRARLANVELEVETMDGGRVETVLLRLVDQEDGLS